MLILTTPDAVPEADSRAGAATDPVAHDDLPMLTPWACGLIDDGEAGAADRCADIIPELMVELI
jgi:hypothetical protein